MDPIVDIFWFNWRGHVVSVAFAVAVGFSEASTVSISVFPVGLIATHVSETPHLCDASASFAGA